jgi:hypothetical protein
MRRAVRPAGAEDGRETMGENVEPNQQAGQTSGAGYVVAASLPDRATVARLVEVESTGFRIAGPARVHP